MRCSRGSVEGNGGGSDSASFPVYLVFFSPDGITVMILWCVVYIMDVENYCGDL